MLATAPIFRKVLEAWGIRESVALTKVDLSRAVPVLPLGDIVQAERTTHCVFMLSNVYGAGGAIDADPRDIADWDTIIVNGQVTDPSASPLGLIPVGNDYAVLSAGGTSTADIGVTWVKRSVTAGASPFLALYGWTGTRNSTLINVGGNGALVPKTGMWVPSGDVGDFDLFATAAATVDFQVELLHAPPGVLRPW